MNLDELIEELHELDGRDVGLSSHGHAFHVGGELKVREVNQRTLPENTAITGELYFSLPSEPATDAVAFTIGDSAQIMFMRDWFVSAEPGFRQIHIRLKDETLFLGWFDYEDQ